MFNVLQARGIPSKFVMFPDENHVSIYTIDIVDLVADFMQWVLKPENSLVWHREVLDWINKYSGVADESKLEKETGKLTM